MAITSNQTRALRAGNTSESYTLDGPTFYQFPRLPPELRDIIWKLAMPGPRTVAVRRSRSKVNPRPFIAEIQLAILQVNRESRACTLKKYQPLKFKSGRKSNVYVNLEIDTLSFGAEDHFIRYGMSKHYSGNGHTDFVIFAMDLSPDLLTKVISVAMDAITTVCYGVPNNLPALTCLKNFSVLNMEKVLADKNDERDRQRYIASLERDIARGIREFKNKKQLSSLVKWHYVL